MMMRAFFSSLLFYSVLRDDDIQAFAFSSLARRYMIYTRYSASADCHAIRDAL